VGSFAESPGDDARDGQDEEEQDCGADVSADEEQNGIETGILAQRNAVIDGDDAGQVKDIPLQGDGGILGQLEGGMDRGRIAHDPEVDGLKGERGDEGELQPWVRCSHKRTDGRSGTWVGWRAGKEGFRR